MDRNYLNGRNGNRINAILAAVGFNFHLLIRWFAEFLCALFQAVIGKAKIYLIA
jgi:IS5 family transposase